MTFNLRVPSDGIGVLASSIAESFLNLADDSHGSFEGLNPLPKEFELYPENGVLLPQSETDLQVNVHTICSQNKNFRLLVRILVGTFFREFKDN